MGNNATGGESKGPQKSKLELEAEQKAMKQAVLNAKKDALALSQREAYSAGTPGLPPKAGELVSTSFGFGVVESYSPEVRTPGSLGNVCSCLTLSRSRTAEPAVHCRPCLAR